MTETNWDEINKRKEIDIAVGQAVNIVAEKGFTPTDDNVDKVDSWVKFILDCKKLARDKYLTNNVVKVLPSTTSKSTYVPDYGEENQERDMILPKKDNDKQQEVVEEDL